MSLGIDERKVPESYRNLVGATLIKQFQMAAMASYNHPTEYYLYIDEVQNFVSAPLDKIFEEAQKIQVASHSCQSISETARQASWIPLWGQLAQLQSFRPA